DQRDRSVAVPDHGPGGEQADRAGNPGAVQLRAGPARTGRRHGRGRGALPALTVPGAAATEAVPRIRRPLRSASLFSVGDSPMKHFPRLFLLLLALLPLAACAADTAAPVEGRDYELIAEPGPFAPLAGKIEVVEVFGYPCIHCAHFEPLLEAWVGKLPADVRFTAVPGAFGGHWDAYARAFYAAEQTGVLKRSHADVFKALHERRSLPMQNVSPQELA